MTKLNIGCSSVSGIYKNPGWLNIDKTPFDTRNFELGDPLEGLKYKDNYFEEIHCIHVLEHIERKDHHAFLKELHRVTNPGSLIYVEVPDFIQICKDIITVADNISFFELELIDELVEKQRCQILSIYGKGRWEGDAHRWGFTAGSLWKTVEDAGFKVMDLTPAGPERNYHNNKMVSTHWKQGPIMLARAIK